ncbi:MAG: subclass B3 metallo-beta-lactamase [Ferruginibacter sp.]
MFKNAFQNILLIILCAFSCVELTAQVVKEPRVTEEWERPYQPFRIAGNLYYVGTYDLACYLVTTSKGNILINTGLASSAAQIKKNVETLGFKFTDIKILLTTQAHYDHMGAMAAIKKMTGAQLMADENEVSVLTDGGMSDYEMGKYGRSYAPVKPDRLLHNNDTISLGEQQLVLLHHPGHTKGSCSYIFNVKDNQRTYKVLIANLPSIIIDGKFSEVSTYPTIASDYAYTLGALKKLSFDIWVASHASQFNMHQKHQPGDAYNPAAFIDKAGYDEALDSLQKQYDKKRAEE